MDIRGGQKDNRGSSEDTRGGKNTRRFFYRSPSKVC